MAEPDWSIGEITAAEVLGEWSPNEPGGVLLGFDADAIRFTVASGVDRPGGDPLDENSVFRWASVTKHVFAACLLESGKLPLDMPMGQAMPELPPAPAAATVAQALAMQAGLPDTRETLTLLGFGSHDRTEAEALLDWSVRQDWLNAPPGTEVAYSNGGYRMLEAALARQGHLFSNWVAERAAHLGIGMRSSEYWSDPVPGLVPGHVPNGDGWSHGYQGMHLSAAGSLSGSARDLALWLTDLLRHSYFETMASPLPLTSGETTGYGLGLRLNRIGTTFVPGHGGAQPGYRAAFLICPTIRAGIVMLSNRDDTDAGGMVNKVWARLTGQGHDAEPAGNWAPPGFYVAPEGNLWAEVRESAIVIRDAEEALVKGDDGFAVSESAQSRIRLRHENGELTGSIFHRPARLVPVRNETPHQDLAGIWSRDGACFKIADGIIHWGPGPRREVSPLHPLGNGRWLFIASGRRICLRECGPNELELSLSRSRGVRYSRLR